jgi:hypothetical protein
VLAQGAVLEVTIDFNKARRQKGAGRHPGTPPPRLAGSDAHRRWYGAYMNSEDWAQRRKLVLDRCNHICEGCRTKPATQVHHLTYYHKGFEFLWELVGICIDCHTRLHRGG